MDKVEQKTCVLHLLFASLLIASPVCAQEDPLEDLDEYILKSMTEWQVPGLAVAIVKDDSVVLLKGYGVREVGKEQLVDAHTVFALGSTTKAFTAAAVAMLVDERKVSWDDPVIKHLPWFKLPDPWVTQQVTIRDLLAHRVAGDIGHPTGRLSGRPSPDFLTREEVLRRLQFLELGAPRFRNAFVYCNECYMAAAEIVAAVSQMSWGEFVEARMLEPLQMSSTTTSAYDLWDAEDVRPCWVCVLRGRTIGAEDARIENIAMPHVLGEDGPRPIEWLAVEAAGPAGGMNASAHDLVSWLRLLLGTGVYQGNRLLSIAAVNEMHSPQVIRQPPIWYYPIQYRGADFTGHFWAYGFGWAMTDYRGKKVVLHGGGVVGQASSIALMPEQRLGVAVLSNGQSALPMALHFRIFDAYLGAPEEDWSGAIRAGFTYWETQQRAQEERLAAERARVTVPPFPLERCLGTYTHRAYGQVEIVGGDRGLVLRLSDQFNWPVEHVRDDKFRVVFHDGAQSYPEALTFEFDDDGRVTALRLGGPKYERVAPPEQEQQGQGS
ncbi:MAG: serine hydrolase [Gemmatimonadetes bacterium]|nr:serine hydrolase [Gemmatimonadota bacterium]NIO32736.1 serine hydrolase [Gemmatimonadota bacterium]